VIYADASALFKLVSQEEESVAFSALASQNELVSSELVITELARAALKPGAPDRESNVKEMIRRASMVCDAVSLVPIDQELLIAAGTMPPAQLRSLDAIHVVTALHSGSERFVTYDHRQARAAESAGLQVLSPGT
jgi:predicted nucleic acid-binding protein